MKRTLGLICGLATLVGAGDRARGELRLERRDKGIVAPSGPLAIVLRRDAAGFRIESVTVGALRLLESADLPWSAEFRDVNGRRALVNSRMGAARVEASGQVLTIRWRGVPVGGQFGWSRGKLDGLLRDDNPQGVCLRKMAKLRASHADLLGAGRMLRPLDLADQVPTLSVKWYQWAKPSVVPLPQVMHSLWQRADGQVGLLLVNISDADATLRITLPPGRYPVKPDAGATLHLVGNDGKLTSQPPASDGTAWRVGVPAMSPALVTVAGTAPRHPTPPPRPSLDLLGRRQPQTGASSALPFRSPERVGVEADSHAFPFRYEANELPHEGRPRWLCAGRGPDTHATIIQIADGTLCLDTLSGTGGGMLVTRPRGAIWDVDVRQGFTVEARLRVLACNDHPRFAFWLQTNTEAGLLTLQVYPDRLVAPGRPPVVADMASTFRTIRIVGLPGGKGVRVWLDGRMVLGRVAYLGGQPHQAQLAFGAGASAGRVRADVDYVRFHPTAALAPR